MSSEDSPTFKIQYEYHNPTDVEAEVPSSQNIREVDPNIPEANEDITDGAISEFRNAGYTVTKRTYTEHREITQGGEVVHTTASHSTNMKDEKENEPDDIEYRRPKTKIPKLKFRQAAERVRADTRKSKETGEPISQIPTPRTSIPKLSRVSKIPPPTTKSIVTKREIKETIVTSKPDDEFDKIYEEIVEYSDVTSDLTDSEKIDSEFEDIIHAYDETKVQPPTPKVRQSKIPSLRRKSDHEIEAQKSSTKFTEKSKVRSIPRLKEISMRAEEDNNDLSQVVRHYTKTVRTEKISDKNDLENNIGTDNIDRKNLVKTSEYTKTFKIGEVDLTDQNLSFLDDKTENAKITKTSKLTRIIKSQQSYENDKLLSGERNIIDKTDFTNDTGNKTITKITKYTRTVNTDATNDNNKEFASEDRKPIDGVESINITNTTESKKTVKIEKLNVKDNFDKGIEKNINFADNKNITKTKQLTKNIRTENASQDSGPSGIIQESQINTIDRSASTEYKHNIPMLETENIEKTFVKVGIPVFNKQVSESSTDKNTQMIYDKNIERQISEGSNITLTKEISKHSKILYDKQTENKAIEVKSDKSPTLKGTYTITRVSPHLNTNSKDEKIETKRTKYSINDKELGVSEQNFHQVKSGSPTDITKTVTITRLVSSPGEKSKHVEHKTENEGDIKITQPLTFNFETVNSEQGKVTSSTTSDMDEMLGLKGKVGRLINKIDTKLLSKERNIIEKPDYTKDTKNNTLTKITTSTKTVNIDATNGNYKELSNESRPAVDDVESKNLTNTSSSIKKLKPIERKTQTEDITTMKIEGDIKISQPLTLKFETVNSKGSPGAYTLDSEKDKITISTTTERENENTVNETLDLTGNVERLIKKIGPQLLSKEKNVIEEKPDFNNDTGNKTKITKSTRTVNTDATNENNKQSAGENIKPFDDVESRSLTKTEVMKTITLKELIDKSSLNEEIERNFKFADNKNITKTKELTNIDKTENLSKNSGTNNIIQESQINSINRSMSMENKHSIPILKTENIEKTFVKVGIPVFNKQVPQSSIEKNTQIVHTDNNRHQSSLSSTAYTVDFEKEKDIISTTTRIEKDKTDNEVLEVKGMVGKLVTKIDTISSTLADIPRKDLDEELTKKKSILSKIAMFERQEINEPMPKMKLRPEKLYIKEKPQEKPVHVHTPQIVDQVLKPKTSEISDLEIKTTSPQDPFVTYKHLYEHYKNMEINKSTESLDSRGEATNFLEVKAPNLQAPYSPLRTTIDINSPNNKYGNAPIIVDAPVILVSPKINFKKNINLNTDDNTAEFAKTAVSVKETRNIEVLKPVQINVDYEVSNIEVESPKTLKMSKDTDITAFKDIKRNIAMYENYSNISQTAHKDKSIITNNYTVDTKSDKDRANFEIKVKNDNTKPINETFTTKDDITFESVKPINNILRVQDFNKNIKSINEILTAKEEFKHDIITPVRQTMTTKKMVYEKIEPPNKMATKEENKYERARPVSEILTTKTEFQYDKVGTMNRELTVKDENRYEKVRPVSEMMTTKTGVIYEHAPPIDYELRVKNESGDKKARPLSEILTTHTGFIYDNAPPINYELRVKNESGDKKARPLSEILTTHTGFIYDNAPPINYELRVKNESRDKKARPLSEILTTKTEFIYNNGPPINHGLRVKNESTDKKARPLSEILTTETKLQCNLRPISQVIAVRDENKYEKERSTRELSGSTRYRNDEQKYENWYINRSISSSYNSALDRTDVLSNETYRLDGKYGRYQSRGIDDDIRKVKSVAELDLGDAVKGKVNTTIQRMKFVERFNTDKKEVINIKEMPKMKSVWEKVALFEGRATVARSDSLSMSSRAKSAKTRPTMQMTEEEYQQKLDELHSAKKRYGKREQMPSVVLSNGAKMPVMAVGTALIDTRLTSHVVSTAIELGYRAIDGAYIYGNEKEIGDAVREKIADGTVKREDLFITSKLWSTFHRRDLVEKACRASLTAMGLTYFDLYLIHNPMSFKEGDDPIPKIATVLQYSQHDYLNAWYGMEDLVSKGLVKNIGVSNFNSVQIQRILDKGKVKPVVNQVECHPYLSQQRLHSFCAERNIILSCYGVLGSKGTPLEYKSGQSPVIDDPLVQVMASGLDKSPAQLLIRYQIECGHNVVVKTTSGFRLWDNLKALDFTLTPGQIDALHALNRNKRNFAFSGMGDTHKNYPFKIAF